MNEMGYARQMVKGPNCAAVVRVFWDSPRKSAFWGWQSKGLNVPNFDTPHLAPWLSDRGWGRDEAIELLNFGRIWDVCLGDGHSLFKERPGGEARHCDILVRLDCKVKEDFRKVVLRLITVQ